MHHADQAMYQAKHHGRGRVCLFSTGQDPPRHPAMAARPRMRPPRIDADHRQLYLLANRLLEHMQDPGIHPDALLADMAQIFEMARQHFLLEEQVLAQYGYEELAAHRQEHQHLLKKPVS